ncbi:hypothetical protein MHYP_G00083090 [Metynnis hypsauchen]
MQMSGPSLLESASSRSLKSEPDWLRGKNSILETAVRDATSLIVFSGAVTETVGLRHERASATATVTSGGNSGERRWNDKTGHGQMMDVESLYSDFINCDRTGRRNAVPDIKGEGTAGGTSELTKDMAQMDLKAGEADAAGAPAPEAEASGSQEPEQSKEGAS